uniref:Uncharacterized protein n=1 Tax=Physcomitrium patens TaxID=3218 RepID=A0A2K1J0Y4_PHYPA|nr:hypothetical protein PHYPA_023089 [Physcomitrium patens]
MNTPLPQTSLSCIVCSLKHPHHIALLFFTLVPPTSPIIFSDNRGTLGEELVVTVQTLQPASARWCDARVFRHHASLDVMKTLLACILVATWTHSHSESLPTVRIRLDA